MNEYSGDEDFEFEVRKIERERKRKERKEERELAIARRLALEKLASITLKADSYSAKLLCWRVATGDWRYVAYGRRGVGLAIAGGRKRLAKTGHIDTDGMPTDKGVAWAARHAEIDLSDWSRVPDKLTLTERARKAGRASAAGLTPEERTARARKAGLVRGAQLRKPTSSSGDM